MAKRTTDLFRLKIIDYLICYLICYGMERPSSGFRRMRAVNNGMVPGKELANRPSRRSREGLIMIGWLEGNLPV
jgi:hypothetical protein